MPFLIFRALLRLLLRRMLGLHTSWVEFSAEYDRAAASQRALRAQRRKP